MLGAQDCLRRRPECIAVTELALLTDFQAIAETQTTLATDCSAASISTESSVQIGGVAVPAAPDPEPPLPTNAPFQEWFPAINRSMAANPQIVEAIYDQVRSQVGEPCFQVCNVTVDPALLDLAQSVAPAYAVILDFQSQILQPSNEAERLAIFEHLTNASIRMRAAAYDNLCTHRVGWQCMETQSAECGPDDESGSLFDAESSARAALLGSAPGTGGPTDFNELSSCLCSACPTARNALITFQAHASSRFLATMAWQEGLGSDWTPPDTNLTLEALRIGCPMIGVMACLSNAQHTTQCERLTSVLERMTALTQPAVLQPSCTAAGISTDPASVELPVLWPPPLPQPCSTLPTATGNVPLTSETCGAGITAVASGERCNLQCADGFVPNVPPLLCNNGTFEATTYACVGPPCVTFPTPIRNGPANDTFRCGPGVTQISSEANCTPQCAIDHAPIPANILCVDGAFVTGHYDCHPTALPCTVLPSQSTNTEAVEACGPGVAQVPSGFNCIPQCIAPLVPNPPSILCTNGTLAGTTYSCVEPTCAAPVGVANAAAPSACTEGSSVPNSQACTAACAAGFTPSVQSLACTVTTLYPATFACDACTDVPGWTDSSGQDCATYAANSWCGSPDAAQLANGGYTADTACCRCGGGAGRAVVAPVAAGDALDRVVSGSMALEVPDAAAFAASAEAHASVQAALAVSAAISDASAVQVQLTAARRLAAHEFGRRLTGNVNVGYSFDSTSAAADAQTAALGAGGSQQMLVRVNQQLAQRGASALSVTSISSMAAASAPSSGGEGFSSGLIGNSFFFCGFGMKLLYFIFTFSVFSAVKERFGVREGRIVTALKALCCMPCYLCQVMGHCEHLTEIGILGNAVGLAQH